MGRQSANAILMIRPVQFRMNEQTAVNNYYQNTLETLSPENVNERAQHEFDGLVDRLRSVGVQVIVVDDTKKFDTPDSIFPNNWLSTHEDGSVVLYPMFAENRRLERRLDILDSLRGEGFLISEIRDYSVEEQNGKFLEGTGSMIFDRENEKAYAALSPRADSELFLTFCKDMCMQPIVFRAYQSVGNERLLIYHTNVMMSISDSFAIICTECIDDQEERIRVLRCLQENGKEVVEISESQVNHFAGNMLQVKGHDGTAYLVMSSQAYQCLTLSQIEAIEKYCPILHAPLDTIEACGGGSARCMMAEIFLPRIGQ